MVLAGIARVAASNVLAYEAYFEDVLDPNGDGVPYWPRYTKESPQLLAFSDEQPKLSIVLDTYRAEGMAYLTNLSLADPM